MAASRRSASSCISWRASTSRCQGLTPKGPQPATAIEPSIANARVNRWIIVCTPVKQLLFGQELTQLRFVNWTIDRSKAHMSEACHAMAVDQHARRHPSHLVELRQLGIWVEAHGKCWMKLRQELIRIGAIPIQIDGNYFKPLCFVGAFHNFHPRERLSARPAPRCPEI